MPQTKSAKKALRQEHRRQAVNLLVRQRIKRGLKTAREKPDLKNLTLASKILDQAAKKGIIHQNKASRLKSRLAKLAAKTTLTQISSKRKPRKTKKKIKK